MDYFVMALFSILTFAVAVYFVRWRPPVTERRDFVTTVPWGGVFVALIYASAAVLCLIAYASHGAML